MNAVAFSSGGTGLLIPDESRYVYDRSEKGRYPTFARRSIGAFGINSIASLKAILDEPAHTFLMGECIGGLPVGIRADGRAVGGSDDIDQGHGSLVVETPWSQGYVGGSPKYVDGKLVGNPGGFGNVFAATAWNARHDENLSLVDPKLWHPIPPNDLRKAKFWEAVPNPSIARPSYYSSTAPLPIDPAIKGSELPASVGSLQGFRTSHETIPMILADGSVRQMSLNTDRKIWVMYSTIWGREPP